MLERNRGGGWNKLLAAVSALHLLTHDPSASLAAVPKEIEELQPRGGDLKKYFERRYKKGVDQIIEEMKSNYEKAEKILEGMRSDLAKIKQLGQEIETIIRDQITKGTDESTLDTETRNYINKTRKDVADGIAEAERKIKESEEKIAPIKRFLDNAIELKKKLDDLDRRR